MTRYPGDRRGFDDDAYTKTVDPLKAHTHASTDIVSGARVTAAGTATLVASTVTVATAHVSASCAVLVTTQVPGAFAGWLSVTNIVPGVSFDIVSAGVGDTSVVGWMIVEP